MKRVYIDRVRIAERRPPIVLEHEDGDKTFHAYLELSKGVELVWDPNRDDKMPKVWIELH